MAKSNAALAETKSSLPAELDEQLARDAGVGFEKVGMTDKVLPFVQIAQGLSPQLDRGDASYIPDLRVGDIFNTATNRVWPGDTGIMFVPAAYQLKHNEWVPRHRGGGFVGERGPEIMSKISSEERDGKFANWLPNGNTIVITAVWYGLIVNLQDPEDVTAAVIPFSSTQLKKSKKLMSQLDDRRLLISGKMQKPPLFFNLLEATSVPEQNDKGKWAGWKIAVKGSVRDLQNGGEIYAQAKKINEAAAANQLRTTEPPSEDGHQGGSEDQPM